MADSKAYCKRTLGLCLEQRVGLITLVPRACAVRQEVEAWGQRHSVLPLLLEKPGRTRQEPPRRWHGQSVVRRVPVEYADGRLDVAEIRFLVVHSSQLAHQAAVTYALPPKRRKPSGSQRTSGAWKPAGLPVPPMRRRLLQSTQGVARGGVGASHGRGVIMSCTIRSKRSMSRKSGRGEAVRRRRRSLRSRAAIAFVCTQRPWFPPRRRTGGLSGDHGGARGVYGSTRVAPGVSGATYHGGTWLSLDQNPAAISPVWLEKPARIAALAMLTVVGLLVYAVIQRQVRLYLRDHNQQIPGNKGPTATPTAAVVFALFTPVMLVQFVVENTTSLQVHGVQGQHLIVCEAVGIDLAWYQGAITGQNALPRPTPP